MMRFAAIFVTLPVWLAAAGVALGGDPHEPTITFARSGAPAEVRLQAPEGLVLPETVVLTAFGRTWTEPAAVRGNSARFGKIPKVRVPTVFVIVSPNDTEKLLGEVIAYPKPTMEWPKGTAVFGAGPPVWFTQWAHAVGLQVESLAGLDGLTPALLRAKAKSGGEVDALLVVGQNTAGENPWELLQSAQQHQTNVLILAARWASHREDHRKPLEVRPRDMVGPLSEMQSHKWRQVPAFSTQRLPWTGIVNRRPWIAGEACPLVEELVNENLWPRRVVISYAPWERQLGRSEIADVVFRRLLLTAAKPAEGKVSLAHRVEMLYPQVEKVTGGERPVLRVALKAGEARDEVPLAHGRSTADSVLVLDVRGDQSPETLPADTLKQFQDHMVNRQRLLILGDAPLLDRLQLGLDRTKKTSGRQAVTWLADDALPPTLAHQLRLMQALTELEVQLNATSSEEGDQR